MVSFHCFGSFFYFVVEIEMHENFEFVFVFLLRILRFATSELTVYDNELLEFGRSCTWNSYLQA